MEDLGLRELSNDQLLELVVQACNEIVRRDPLLRKIAQYTIFSKAEELELERKALKDAVVSVRADYETQIRKEACEAVSKGFRDGTIRLLTAAQEARVVADATLEAKIARLDSVIRKIEEGALRDKDDEWWRKATSTNAPSIEPMHDHEIDRDRNAYMRMMQSMRFMHLPWPSPPPPPEKP